ncbi:permease-like cell division protein FtsX [Dethiobacter alkaliphilus]|uniref:permease-like cell division protein FtsX n=1 Tax=Dethiobacter alkaliphilus TaxID=427926 RepID=UPI002225BAC7|nr:permease-like cell division protein FtsX [Dethiobacter alkaliphilus]MCW3490994.1 permease-like cell division protein FtsX [Dethiobacter alkaliphilus]
MAVNINSVRYCLRQSVVALFRNLWLALVTSGIIAISLAILGGFLLLAVNASQFMRNIESNVEISVFLEDGADPAALQAQLDGHEDVSGYTFVPKDEGLEEFGRTMGDRVMLVGLEGENNPLPDMFRVRAHRAEAVPALAAEIQSYSGVEVTDFGEELVARVGQVTGWLNTLFLIVSGLLALGAIFLIVTTIRLSVLARQDEVGIMKYLGASNWFIRFPFLLEGMVMGWTGTVAAAAALSFVYFRVAYSLQTEALAFFLQPVTDMARILPIFVGLLLMGTLMGGVGSYVSVRKFLRV